MPKPYGISGTPWHVEQIHNNDPKDTRRHRSRCVFYNKFTKYCSKQVGSCFGASHCKYYIEKTNDLIFDEDYKPDYHPVQEKPKVHTEKTVKYKPCDIKIGSLVTVKKVKYLVTNIRKDISGYYRFVCVRAERKDTIHDPELSKRWLHKNLYLSTDNPKEFLASQFESALMIRSKAMENLRTQGLIPSSKNKINPNPNTFPQKTPGNDGNSKKKTSDNSPGIKKKYRIIAYEKNITKITQKKLLRMS